MFALHCLEFMFRKEKEDMSFSLSCPIRFQSGIVLGEQVDGPWACGCVPRGCAVAVTTVCQGGAGATGDSRAAAANVRLVDAVLQQQCGILQQNDEGIIRQDSG